MRAAVLEAVRESVKLCLRARSALQTAFKSYIDPNGGTTIDDMVDDLYLLKQAEQFYDQYARDLRRQIESQSGQLALVFMASYKTSHSTDWATATNKTEAKPSIPEKGSPEYRELLTYLGVPEDRHEEDGIRPHWPTIKAQCELALSQGKPLPPGINPQQTTLKPSIAIRAKQELLPIDMASATAPTVF